MKRFTLTSIAGAILGAIFAPVPRKRAQLGGLDLGDDAREMLELIEEVKSAAVGAADANSTKLLELADRLQKIEQKGGAQMDGGNARSEGPAEILLKSPDLTRLRNGEIKSARFPMKSLETKAVTLVSGAANGAAQRDPDIVGPEGPRVSVRSLIPRRTTTLGSIEFVVGSRTTAASTLVQATEGSVKAQTDVSTTLVTAPVVTIAAFTVASRQVLDDGEMLKDWVESTMKDQLADAEDAQLLHGTGTGGQIGGLVTLAAAYSRTVTGDNEHQTLRRAATQVQIARGWPTGVVLSPEGLERIEVDVGTDGHYTVSLNVDDGTGQTRLWRMPVIVSDSMGSAEFLVGDFARAARIWDRQQAHIEIGFQDDQFVRNLVTVLCEQRLALTVRHPTRFVTGSFT